MNLTVICDARQALDNAGEIVACFCMMILIKLVEAVVVTELF